MKSSLSLCLLLVAINIFPSSVTRVISVLDHMYGTNIKQLHDLDNLKEIEEKLKDLSNDQLDNLVGQLNAMTGNYGYGNYFNSQEDKNDQKWSPSSWSDALSGNPGNNEERYEALLTDYKQQHPYFSKDEMLQGASEAHANDYQQTVAVNQVANVQASYEFNDVNKHLANIQALTDSIEKAENQKAIADLNARINAEVAYLSVETIKMLTILNHQYAQHVANDLSERQQASIMNQIPH